MLEKSSNVIKVSHSTSYIRANFIVLKFTVCIFEYYGFFLNLAFTRIMRLMERGRRERK